MFDKKTILISGGTGSLGQKLTERILSESVPEKIIIYSRDEFKQSEMIKKFAKYKDQIRMFIGDIRDKDRLNRAMKGVDIVIHTAALKQVPALEYNPIEAVKTNIQGTINIVETSIDNGVNNVIGVSTDKACSPVNLYGATKLVAEKMLIQGNAYVGNGKTKISVVRYGNVTGSRGSVLPLWRELIKNGHKDLPITDSRMTRYWITIDKSVDMIFNALRRQKGGEIFIPKLPSYNIGHLAMSLGHEILIHEIGIRESEKLHETLITEEESRKLYDYGNYYVIYPHADWWSDTRLISGGVPANNIIYKSDTNDNILTVDKMREMVEKI